MKEPLLLKKILKMAKFMTFENCSFSSNTGGHHSRQLQQLIVISEDRDFNSTDLINTSSTDGHQCGTTIENGLTNPTQFEVKYE